MEIALQPGMLEARLVNETQVLVTLPVASATPLNHMDEVNEAMKTNGKTSKGRMKAHTTAANKYKKKKQSKTYKLLVDFSQTGEKLTNAALNPGAKALGLIKPKSTKLERTFIHKGKEYKKTELAVSFLVARVEPDERYLEEQTDDEFDNLVADDISVQAMEGTGGASDDDHF